MPRFTTLHGHKHGDGPTDYVLLVSETRLSFSESTLRHHYTMS